MLVEVVLLPSDVTIALVVKFPVAVESVITNADVFHVFLPVPPLATGKVPVTPGRGDAAKTLAAAVVARFVNIDGFAVRPVPPCPTANVPVIGSVAPVIELTLPESVDNDTFWFTPPGIKPVVRWPLVIVFEVIIAPVIFCHDGAPAVAPTAYTTLVLAPDDMARPLAVLLTVALGIVTVTFCSAVLCPEAFEVTAPITVNAPPKAGDNAVISVIVLLVVSWLTV
jgi:hypothetical protein